MTLTDVTSQVDFDTPRTPSTTDDTNVYIQVYADNQQTEVPPPTGGYGLAQIDVYLDGDLVHEVKATAVDWPNGNVFLHVPAGVSYEIKNVDEPSGSSNQITRVTEQTL